MQLKSAVADPMSLTAVIVYRPVFSDVVFLIVSRENVPSPSILKFAPVLSSTSPTRQAHVGVGAPSTLTVSISDCPTLTLSFKAAASYSIAGAAMKDKINSGVGRTTVAGGLLCLTVVSVGRCLLSMFFLLPIDAFVVN